MMDCESIDERIEQSTGRKPLPLAQIDRALKAGLHNVLVRRGEQPIGMGRLIGDGNMYWYIQDPFINPAYQGQGIGKLIMEYLTRHIESSSLPNTTVTVGLFSAIGKDGFYEKLGFSIRPSEIYGVDIGETKKGGRMPPVQTQCGLTPAH